MSNPNLAIRFTDETYASRAEVVRTLGTSLIEPIWVKILEYRSQYSSLVGLTDVNKEPFEVILCSNVVSKSGQLGARFAKFKEEYDFLEEGSISKNTFRVDIYKTSLRYLAKLKGIIINDIALENIVYGRNSNLLYQPLVNYFNALRLFERKATELIDDSLIAGYLETLNGGGELLSYYRNQEISMPGQKVLINREYAGAPVEQIERMMNELLEFIRVPNYDLSIKLAVIYYMMNYIKPFESFNEEISLLLMRNLIARENANGIIGPAASMLPLEVFLSDARETLANAAKESQKTRDLTYFVNEASKRIEEAINLSIDRMIQVSRTVASEGLLDEEPQQSEQEPAISTFIEPQKAPEAESHPIQQQYVVNPEPVVEPAPAPVSQPKPAPAPVERQKPRVEVANNQPKVDVTVYQDLDEKALRRATEDLLESDPNLRPSQAHFYVRHCTMGKYYTIQQFKKAEGVVYETARTSMDNLAKRGYYRREQVKNKFVYTPISKK